MVAKATQNLFDVNIGGAGFHVTSHLIALAALFIACFAIAGYISFRDDSVPESALKAGAKEVNTLITTVSPPVAVTTGTALDLGSLPANAMITRIDIITEVVTVGAATSDLDFEIGVSGTSGQVVALGGTGAESIMRNSTLQGGYNSVKDYASQTVTGRSTAAARDLQVNFVVSGADLTTAGSYSFVVTYVQL